MSTTPTTNEPAALTDLNQKAAAVQAAIWFFSDRYVLNTSDPLHDAVVEIVDQIRSEGPLPEPARAHPHDHAVACERSRRIRCWDRSRSPTSASHATVTATGGSMFSDSAGTVPIANGATVPSGQKIWVRSTGPTIAVLEATSEATVPTRQRLPLRRQQRGQRRPAADPGPDGHT